MDIQNYWWWWWWWGVGGGGGGLGYSKLLLIKKVVGRATQTYFTQVRGGGGRATQTILLHLRLCSKVQTLKRYPLI